MKRRDFLKAATLTCIGAGTVQLCTAATAEPPKNAVTHLIELLSHPQTHVEQMDLITRDEQNLTIGKIVIAVPTRAISKVCPRYPDSPPVESGREIIDAICTGLRDPGAVFKSGMAAGGPRIEGTLFTVWTLLTASVVLPRKALAGTALEG